MKRSEEMESSASQRIAPVVPEAADLPSMAKELGLEFAPTLNGQSVSHDFLAAVPIGFARQHTMIGFSDASGGLRVALCDPMCWAQLQTVQKLLGLKVEPILARREDILQAINSAYQQQDGQTERLIDELDGPDLLAELEAGETDDLLDVASRAPVVKLVNLLLLEAIKRRASDVHVQPYEDRLVARFRVDGVLRDVFDPPKALQAEIISRIKIMGGMNIAETRLPQDGRSTVEMGQRIIDLRISTLPTSFGERAVIRLLDKSIRLYELARLGMGDEVTERFRRLIHADHGIILVTGPTGSGKTTTLYAALGELDCEQLNILTLEDPIEYRLESISQTQVSEKKGMTFASGLRHVLRQDPDVIMVGEIRDRETAHMAIQSALTGHLVFSTLHTNDAAGAVARMLDLGVEPYLLASSLLGVLAQRLVRMICPDCREPYRPDAADLHRWNLSAQQADGMRFFRGAGCPQCGQSGYRERGGLFELLTVSEPVRELILQRAKASTLKEQATAQGMTSLYADGLAKVQAGLTTADEVHRVTGREEF